jgi:hypothetical protein
VSDATTRVSMVAVVTGFASLCQHQGSVGRILRCFPQMYNFLSGNPFHMLVRQMPWSFIVCLINIVNDQASYYLKSNTAKVSNQRLGESVTVSFNSTTS